MDRPAPSNAVRAVSIEKRSASVSWRFQANRLIWVTKQRRASGLSISSRVSSRAFLKFFTPPSSLTLPLASTGLPASVSRHLPRPS